MKSYIVRQPIYNAKLSAWAYEIMYSDESGAYESSAGMERFFLDYAAISRENEGPVFVTFTYSMLEHKVAELFAPEKLVIQLNEDVLLMPATHGYISELQNRGYRIALVGFNFNARVLTVMGKLDFIKLNFSIIQPSFRSVLDVAHNLGKRVIAYNVNDEQGYSTARSLGVDFMQGTYLAAMQPSVVHSAEHMPANFAQLLVAINAPDPDYDELERIISRDVALTYSILKLVNSAYFSPRSRISSIRQALSFLGVKQLKEWVYLLGFQNSANLPLEYMKLSLLRAKFCSELQPLVPGIELTAAEAYLAGLLSTLDALLGLPIEKVLDDVDVSDAIRAALLGEEDSKAAALYQFVRGYEVGDWNRTSVLAKRLGISEGDMGKLYLRCEDEVNKMWEGILSAGRGSGV